MTLRIKILLVLVLALGGEAAVGMCVSDNPSLTELYASHEHVFVTKIISARVANDPATGTERLALEHQAVELFKGDPSRVTLTGGSGRYVENSNFSPVLVGAYYLIFANSNSPSTIGMCSVNQISVWENDYASNNILQLRKLFPVGTK